MDQRQGKVQQGQMGAEDFWGLRKRIWGLRRAREAGTKQVKVKVRRAVYALRPELYPERYFREGLNVLEQVKDRKGPRGITTALLPITRWETTPLALERQGGLRF